MKELPVKRSVADSFPLVETKRRVVDSYVGVVREVTAKAAKIEARKIAANKTKRFLTTNRYSLSLKGSLPLQSSKLYENTSII